MQTLQHPVLLCLRLDVQDFQLHLRDRWHGLLLHSPSLELHTVHSLLPGRVSEQDEKGLLQVGVPLIEETTLVSLHQSTLLHQERQIGEPCEITVSLGRLVNKETLLTVYNELSLFEGLRVSVSIDRLALSLDHALYQSILSVMMGNLLHDDSRDTVLIYDHDVTRHFTPPGMTVSLSLPILSFLLDFYGSHDRLLLSFTQFHLSLRKDSS